jgi:hypothetical protein
MHWTLPDCQCILQLEVRLPNGTVVASTHTATLDLPSLPMAARQALILTGLAQHPLLYVGQIYAIGCDITSTAADVTFKHVISIIIAGKHEFHFKRPCQHRPNRQPWLTMCLRKDPCRTQYHICTLAVSSPSKTIGPYPLVMVTLSHGHMASPNS